MAEFKRSSEAEAERYLTSVRQEVKLPKTAKPESKHVLNVPCLGWIYSQSPKIPQYNNEVKTPIIIWLLEPMPPKRIKRSIFYSRLDEDGSPLRTNASKAIRRDNTLFGPAKGFNINATNTYRYIYGVPKIIDERYGGEEVTFRRF